MIRFLLLIAIITFAAGGAGAQTERVASAVNADQVVSTAERHISKGEACIKEGNSDCARREFDLAIDAILELGIDVRGHERLRVAYRELIEKISLLERAPTATSANGIWRTQEFDGRPPEIKSEAATAIDYSADGPLSPAEFQRRFGELRAKFREKYDRDMTLTGADHGEHRRLYGRGSAFDIRVRDLTREQVTFIIKTGDSLGLRIKDFSTWDRVAAHNARTIMLGRPLDTLATGIHLHIDRMALPKRQPRVSTPAVASKVRKTGKSKEN
jgi:hypothetical protein